MINRILLAICAAAFLIAASAANCDDSESQSTTFLRMVHESRELFRTGRFHPALFKSQEALSLAEAAFTKNSWQYVRATSEFSTILKATKLSPVDQAALEEVLEGMGRQHRQIRGGNAEVAEKAGPDLLEKCDKLLGTNSCLSDLELDLLCQALNATGKGKEERKVLLWRLKRLESNRMSDDPDLIVCRMLLAVNSSLSPEEIWSAASHFNLCIKECRKHPEDSKVFGFVSLACAMFLNEMNAPERSLEYTEKGRKLLGTELSEQQRIEVGRICAIALAHMGKGSQAHAELAAIEPLVKGNGVAVRAVQELVRTEVYLASDNIPKATSAFAEYKDLTKEMSTSPRRMWSIALEGELAVKHSDFRKAEEILGELTREWQSSDAPGRDHPRNLRPLKLLSQVKKNIGKSAEADGLNLRIAKLTTKMREAVETAIAP